MHTDSPAAADTVRQPGDLFAWITRPSCHEVLMGGIREVELWLAEPLYCHLAQPYFGAEGENRYVDRGWTLGRSDSGSRAKPMLKQDPAMLLAVWRQIVWSCAPKGMGMDEAAVWQFAEKAVKPNWRTLMEDEAWESKCNCSDKRFLLQVGLRSGSVERVLPKAQLRDEYGPGYRNPAPAVTRTDQISDALALEFMHEPNPYTDLPF